MPNEVWIFTEQSVVMYAINTMEEDFECDQFYNGTSEYLLTLRDIYTIIFASIPLVQPQEVVTSHLDILSGILTPPSIYD